MKVERVSYDVMTPSAARAIFDSILWKPAISWRITRIDVLKPVSWINLRRNEVGAVIPVSTATEAMARGTGNLALYIEDERQQRAGLFLRDVAYRIHGYFEMTSRAAADESPPKFAEMFRRRAEKGQCFNQPYLGCREFSCGFRYVENPDAAPPPEDVTRDLGLMLYDLDFTDAADPRPFFFNARLEHGVMAVPPLESAEVLR